MIPLRTAKAPMMSSSTVSPCRISTWVTPKLPPLGVVALDGVAGRPHSLIYSKPSWRAARSCAVVAAHRLHGRIETARTRSSGPTTSTGERFLCCLVRSTLSVAGRSVSAQTSSFR
jgi:hypothetical protein